MEKIPVWCSPFQQQSPYPSLSEDGVLKPSDNGDWQNIQEVLKLSHLHCTASARCTVGGSCKVGCSKQRHWFTAAVIHLPSFIEVSSHTPSFFWFWLQKPHCTLTGTILFSYQHLAFQNPISSSILIKGHNFNPVSSPTVINMEQITLKKSGLSTEIV